MPTLTSLTYKLSAHFIKLLSLFVSGVLIIPETDFFFFFMLTFFFFICSEFCHTLNEKALGSHVFPIPIPPPTSLPTHSLQVLPEHQVRALVSCIHPGPVICFTLDSMHVSMLFSWNIPPSPSPKSLKDCSINLCLFFCSAYRVFNIFLNSIYMC